MNNSRRTGPIINGHQLTIAETGILRAVRAALHERQGDWLRLVDIFPPDGSKGRTAHHRHTVRRLAGLGILRASGILYDDESVGSAAA